MRGDRAVVSEAILHRPGTSLREQVTNSCAISGPLASSAQRRPPVPARPAEPRCFVCRWLQAPPQLA
eukprot:8957637-Alexandrium_andersonii.AAC.1